jgi:hypothetical protein
MARWMELAACEGSWARLGSSTKVWADLNAESALNEPTLGLRIARLGERGLQKDVFPVPAKRAIVTLTGLNALSRAVVIS